MYLTFVAAIMLLATMAIVQSRLGLGDFSFGSKWSYSEKTFREAINNDRSKPPLVVVPLLFPLDLLFLIFFGLFLALCSIAHAEALGLPPSRAALLTILPVIYMAADLSENILYSGMLLWPDTIGHLIYAAGWATRAKLVAVALAMMQALGALVASWRS